MFIAAGSFIWDDSNKPAGVHYSKSQEVRDWLVHTALAASNVPLTPALRASHSAAFQRVCTALRLGQVNLDYAPQQDDVLDIPPINHPHHMQAMLYWCVRLDCTLALLSEAYAQLGRGASAAQASATLQRLSREESPAVGGWLRSLGRSISPAATLPMFRG